MPEEDDGGLTTDEIAAFKQTTDASGLVVGAKTEGGYSQAVLATAVLLQPEDEDEDSDESDDDDL